jgi:endonuclease/exonuclease/phosphatase (EEP) superfamily protein YafD
VTGVLACAAVVAAGCDGKPLPDATAPTLTLEAFGALHALKVDSAVPGTGGTVRARSDDKVQITVRAADPESGIGRVHVGGYLDSVCVPSAGSNKVTVREPLGELVTASGSPEGLMVHRFQVDVAARRAACPASTRFYELKGELIASADNGRKATTTLPAVGFVSFGPDIVSIATFNMWQPGNHPDATYTRWGQQLGRHANALILTETPDLRRAQLVADAAGLPHVVFFNDVAIVSQAPIRDVKRHRVDPPGNLTSNDSIILAAQTDLGGYPHQIIGTHWGIRDANDELFPAERSAPGRIEAAKKIVEMLDPSVPVTFVGGDLNAYSGVGPQRVPGSTAEVDLLRGALTDPYIAMSEPNDRHCSDQRIDYVMFRGPVSPIRYSACFPEAGPSDHPFVLVTFSAG